MKQKKTKPIQTTKKSFDPLRSFIKKFIIERSTLFLIMIVLLSVSDAFFTLFWIKKGWATEANPILSELLNHGDRWFLAIKFSFTYLGCMILYLARGKRFAIRSIKIILMLYVLLTAYHLFGVLAAIEFSLDHDHLKYILSEFRIIFLSF